MENYLFWFNMKTIFIALLIVIPIMANGQSMLTNYAVSNTPLMYNNNPLLKKKKPIPDNLWGIDFSIIGISCHYARRIIDGLYVGGENGYLPDQFNWVLAGGRLTSQENTIWSKDKREAEYNDLKQLLFFHLFLRWKPDIQWFELEGGFRWALFDHSEYELDGLSIVDFYGAYIKPTFGLRKIKIGFRLDAGNMRLYVHTREFMSIISPLIRYNFQ